MLPDATLSCWLEVDGCFNVRDAGGWELAEGERRMRTGLLYRADEPARLTDAGRKVVDDLGLRAVIDLRSARQFERDHGYADRARIHHVPIVDTVIATDERRRVDVPADLTALYRKVVRTQRPNFVRAVGLVAEHVADGPVLVHCVAGKDRTGIVVALVHAAIGVPLDSIVADYERSDAPTRLRREEMLARPMAGDPDVAGAPELIWTAPGEAIRLFLAEEVERAGSLEDWPQSFGVPAGAVAALRRHLVTD